MKVHWTRAAIASLDAICGYLAEDAPRPAAALERRLLMRSGQISLFPHSGRKVPDYGLEDVRELIEGNYRIIYCINATQVDVLTVMHCRQLLPTDFHKL